MKNAKKYIYPFAFSICFFLSYIILSIVLEIIDLPSGNFDGLAYAFIVLIIWILVIIPVYCFKYCKIIFGEKSIFLFGLYNSIVVALCHTGPFLISAIPNGDANIIIKITLAIFGWVALCTYIWFLIRLNTTDKQDDNSSNETVE